MRAARIFGTAHWDEGKIRRFVQAWNDGVEAEFLGERFGILSDRVSQLIGRFRRAGLDVTRIQQRRNLRNLRNYKGPVP